MTHQLTTIKNASALWFLVTRCNDVLELVETIRHFQLLETAAEIGGAGTASLDAMVREIQDTYRRTIHTFTSQNSNILSTDKNQSFEKAFFNFRTTIKASFLKNNRIILYILIKTH